MGAARCGAAADGRVRSYIARRDALRREQRVFRHEEREAARFDGQWRFVGDDQGRAAGDQLRPGLLGYSSMLKVFVSGHLKTFTSGETEFTLQGVHPNVADALDSLWTETPALRDRILNEQGEIRQHV